MLVPRPHPAQPAAAVPRRAVLLTLPPSVQRIPPCPWPLPLPSQPAASPHPAPHPRLPRRRALQPRETLLIPGLEGDGGVSTGHGPDGT